MDKDLIYDKQFFEDYSKSLEFKKIKQWVNNAKKILEIGCHVADLGQLLKNEDNIVTGIDYNEKAIEIAKSRIDNAFVIDLNKKFVNENNIELYDVIVCNQVLEHLLNPEKTLLEIKKMLKPDSTLIIGLPNICNAKDRFDITFGKFEYTEIGVMDKTHVRFFNYFTAKQMLENSGLIIEDYFSPWQVNPVKHFLNHIPILWRISKLMKEKPRFLFKKRRNLTDTVMLFKCKLKNEKAL